MKKWINRQTIAAFLIGAILFSGIGVGAATLYQFSLSPDRLYVDGTKIDESVYKYKDVNYLPIRTVAEAFGAEIDYGYGRIDIDRKREPSVADVAEKVKGSCVLIIAFDKNSNPTAQGSGVVYNGYIITAKHVLDEGVRYAVAYDDMEDGYGYDTDERIHFDTDLDIGLLKAPINGHTAKLGDSDKVEIGQQVIGVSSPDGIKNLVYDGKVTKLGLYSSVKSYAGGSGGGLFDMDGKLIGILKGIHAKSNDVTKSIPINDVKEIFDSLK